MSRADLYRRLQLAHQAAQQSHRQARQDVLDRGALIAALVEDGASYSEIAAHLPKADGEPVTKQRVGDLLRAYHEASK